MYLLDQSKVLMYELDYDCIKNKYGNNSRLLFTDTDTDTDCLMYQIKTKDVYEDFSKYKEMCDFSNYLSKSKYYDSSKQLVFGKMKDEADGAAVEDFFGLKPKMNSFLVNDNSEHKKAKGGAKMLFQQ